MAQIIRNDADTVLVTGARGFVGRPVVEALLASGSRVTGAVRTRPQTDRSVEGKGLRLRTEETGGEGGYSEVAAGELGPETDWREALAGVDVVVHLAARVHQMQDRAADPLAEFRRVNVEGTRHLAEQAAAAGVRRFIFVSSIKVNGEGTAPGEAYRETDVPAPADPYGISKLEAEEALRQVGAQTGLEVVILRPPLMVGQGVKGNLAALAGAIRRGRPLPFGAITENRRSLLDVRNLADAIVCCASHPQAAGEVFLVSDGVPVSTAELARRAGKAVGRAPFLLPVPVALLRIAGRLAGKGAAVGRLTGSLLIDDSKIRRLLGWQPRFGPEEWKL
jgi:nucleoside-diphosphate-sugar epimerase